MFALLFLLCFILLPLLELWLILQVGELIGAVPTILLLLGSAVLGAWLMKSQGGQAWRSFRAATSAGRVPAAEAVDGFFVIFGGTLLLLPGFLSDGVGLLLLLPSTRKLLRERLIGHVNLRARASFAGWPGPEDQHVRDFAHSNQPRRAAATDAGERYPDFDLETHQLSE